MKALLARTALPLAVLLCLGVFLTAREAGLNLESVVLAATVMTLLAALAIDACIASPGTARPAIQASI